MRTVDFKQLPARKEHTCDLCDCPIHKGDIYLKSVGEDGGELYTFHIHKECQFFAIKTRLVEELVLTSEVFKEKVFEMAKEKGLENWDKLPVKKLVDLLIYEVELS